MPVSYILQHIQHDGHYGYCVSIILTIMDTELTQCILNTQHHEYLVQFVLGKHF